MLKPQVREISQAERDQYARDKAEVLRLCQTVPVGAFQKWDVMMCRQFKDACSKALVWHKKVQMDTVGLRHHLTTLRRYHGK